MAIACQRCVTAMCVADAQASHTPSWQQKRQSSRDEAATSRSAVTSTATTTFKQQQQHCDYSVTLDANESIIFYSL